MLGPDGALPAAISAKDSTYPVLFSPLMIVV
jgi:hypothetical protein